jgi:hypothetical protein
MADLSTFQVVNGTGQPLVASYNHHYQMNTWSFSNIGNANYTNFTVKFFDGSHDEDDGAEQNYSYGGSDVIQIQARSDDHSNHFLKVLALDASNPNLVLVTNAAGLIIGALPTSPPTWSSLSAASDPQNPAMIGELTSNLGYLGLGLVDLSLLFSDPSQLQTYINAIQADNLSHAQVTALNTALSNLINGTNT